MKKFWLQLTANHSCKNVCKIANISEKKYDHFERKNISNSKKHDFQSSSKVYHVATQIKALEKTKTMMYHMFNLDEY